MADHNGKPRKQYGGVDRTEPGPHSHGMMPSPAPDPNARSNNHKVSAMHRYLDKNKS